MKIKSLSVLSILLVSLIPFAHAAQSLALVNTCTAEEHNGISPINCSISTSSGNWIVATGVGQGTNAACSANPISSINAFNFDAGALYTNWQGANKLSVEVYDSGLLSSGGTVVVTLTGQCALNFASLIVYQFSGATGASAPASVNVCNAQPTGVTSLTCSLTGLTGYGWIIGHGAADCVACSFTNQVNTITQVSGASFTDYAGIIKSVTPSVANAFTITNGASFNGGVSALEITGNPPTGFQNFQTTFSTIIPIFGVMVGIGFLAIFNSRNGLDSDTFNKVLTAYLIAIIAIGAILILLGVGVNLGV